MLANTSLGVLGLQALADFYMKNRKRSALELCRVLGLAVVRDNVEGQFHGFLQPAPRSLPVPSKRMVVLPRDGWPILNRFIIFHEIGHFLLRKADNRLAGTSASTELTSQQIEVEMWCDGFATAMVIAQFELMVPKDDQVPFMRGGVQAFGPNLKRAYAKMRVFQGERLIRLAKRAPQRHRGVLDALGRVIISHTLEQTNQK